MPLSWVILRWKSGHVPDSYRDWLCSHFPPCLIKKLTLFPSKRRCCMDKWCLANRPFWEIILKIWPFQKTSIIKKGIPPKKIYSCNKAPRNPKHKQALTNNDRSTCELYLVTNDRELTEQATSATYKERWGVRGIPQKPQTGRGVGKNPNQIRRHPEHPCFCRHDCPDKNRTASNQGAVQPCRSESQAVCQGPDGSLHRVASAQTASPKRLYR